MYTQALRLQRNEVFCLFGERDYVEKNEFLSLVSGDLNNMMMLEEVEEEMREDVGEERREESNVNRKKMIVVTPSISVDEIVTLIQERADILEVSSDLSLSLSFCVMSFF